MKSIMDNLKVKIKVKKVKDVTLPQVIAKGDWVDLTTAVAYNTAENKRESTYNLIMINLGVAMKLPEGYEAILVSRSSTYKIYGIIQANAIGVIDNSYCGDKDVWQFPAIAIKKRVEIPVGSKICQFRIQLSQKATIWQKIKWLFTSGIEFEEVDSLTDDNRGGFGSTGK